MTWGWVYWQIFHFWMHYCFKVHMWPKQYIDFLTVTFHPLSSCPARRSVVQLMMFLCSTCPLGQPCSPGLRPCLFLSCDWTEVSYLTAEGGKNLVLIQQSVIGDTHGLLEAETRALMGPAAAPGDFAERAGGGIQNASVTRRTVSSFHFFVTLLSKCHGVVVRNLSCLFVISCWLTAWFWIDR